MIRIDDTNRHSCVGCGACMQVCPNKCIQMSEDAEGFLYPSVDETDCTQCNACDRICPVGRDLDHPHYDEPEAVAGYHKDDRVLETSSSGGAFTLFARKVIADGGVVCGCVLDDDMKAVHAFTDKADGLLPFCGSKYVQSDTGTSYSKIKEYLAAGRTVLFVGTPCQCAGLTSYLGTSYEGLYVCDFICHGVPSPKVFREYIGSLEKKAGEKITGFRFRTKDRPWVPTGMQQGTDAVTSSGRHISKHPAYKDEFMNGFLSDIMLRPSCYECNFKSLPKSYSDVTIADFWGAGKVAPSIVSTKGTSLILLNTEKGKGLFESAANDFTYISIDHKAAIKHNRSIIRSSPLNSMRYYFFRELEKDGYEKVARKYFTASRWAAGTALKKGWGIIESVMRSVLGPVVLKVKPDWDEKNWEALMQFFKFALVGVSNSIVSYTINVTTLFILSPLKLGFDYIIANTVAFLLSVLWSYNLNNKHVFTIKHGEVRSGRATLLRTYISYAFSGIVLNNVLGTLWIKGLGLSRYVAPLLNLIVTVPTNFILNKYWAYRRRDEKQG